MNKIAKFLKVSPEKYFEAKNEECGGEYADIKLPRRATTGSAGYDFYAPFDFCLEAGEGIKIPTGIRAQIDGGWVLMIFPRSSLGFKYRLQLDNSVGIIDSDYFCSDNEGHIFIKMTNDGNKKLCVKKGEAFAQGVFLPYGICEDDDADGVRNGGFGSTNKN